MILVKTTIGQQFADKLQLVYGIETDSNGDGTANVEFLLTSAEFIGLCKYPIKSVSHLEFDKDAEFASEVEDENN